MSNSVLQKLVARWRCHGDACQWFTLRVSKHVDSRSVNWRFHVPRCATRSECKLVDDEEVSEYECECEATYHANGMQSFSGIPKLRELVTFLFCEGEQAFGSVTRSRLSSIVSVTRKLTRTSASLSRLNLSLRANVTSIFDELLNEGRFAT